MELVAIIYFSLIDHSTFGGIPIHFSLSATVCALVKVDRSVENPPGKC